jgi:hypothetical protein
MTIEQVADLVRRWYEQAGQVNGPVLPDGWFGGRPYDNMFVLENVHIVNDELVIQLSEETRISFLQPRRAFVENSELVFADFDHAQLRWRSYGGTEICHQDYDTGQVRFVPPMWTFIVFP